jgi:hypothetical protein
MQTTIVKLIKFIEKYVNIYNIKSVPFNLVIVCFFSIIHFGIFLYKVRSFVILWYKFSSLKFRVNFRPFSSLV